MKTLITILGPTASGKTTLAVNLANKINGEIISADSRQVYKGMDIGTGKDLTEYSLQNKTVPYHLIDLHPPGYEYNVYEFQTDFLNAFETIASRNSTPILCGGTGMYLSAALANEKLLSVPQDVNLRTFLNEKSIEELCEILNKIKDTHNSTDYTDRSRTIRAIEIETFKKNIPPKKMPVIKHKVYGIKVDREVIKKRITSRLLDRLNHGMIKEVETLLTNGIKPEQLKFYGLEYKYVTEFLEGELEFNDMYQKLNSAIHLFAKKQTTWFRRMEKKGIEICWLEEKLSLNKKLEMIHNDLNV